MGQESAPLPAPAPAHGTVRLGGIRFRYPGRAGYALHVPELTIAAGSRTVITGRSGIGKSTLLSIMAGILSPQTGSVEVDGRRLDRETEAARRRFRLESIGLIFQEFELLEHLTVRENILLPILLHPRRRPDAAAEERLRGLAERAGLADRLRRKPRGLSHGERQRVAICRALITHPALLLADEPTGNLDPDTTRALVDAMFQEATLHGSTLVLVTHDHSLLPRFDRVIPFESLGEARAS